MTLPPAALFVIVLVIGFLSGSTVYFYNKTQVSSQHKSSSSSATFQADLPVVDQTALAKKIDELTKPADPRGRLSYPANIYTVAAKETLFGIGTKFGIDWQLIKLANGVTNENLIQAGYTIVIPKIDPSSDLYRITFNIDDNKASQLNRDLRDKADDPMYNPVEVAKSSSAPYFGITAEDEFTLLEQDESKGTALVQAKNGTGTNVVGLFQPKEKGKKGFWAMLYIEHHD